MPRLGDDPNMATAYPNRVNTNLRGGWMRQMLYTMVMTFVLYKVVFTDYKRATKESMAKKGLSEEEQERLVPKTTAEKRREIQMAKLTQTQRIEALQYEVGNLTNAVIELQQLAVDRYGVTVQHPVTLGENEGDGDEDAAEGDETPPLDGVGGDEDGNPPNLNLRGAGADGGTLDGGGGGGSGDAAGAGGDGGARRLLTREKGEQQGEQTGRAAGRDELAALQGGNAESRQLNGSPRGDG